MDIKLPAGAIVNSITLTVAHNGGAILSIDHKIPRKDKESTYDSCQWCEPIKLAYTNLSEALPAIESAAAAAGINIDAASEETEDDDD